MMKPEPVLGRGKITVEKYDDTPPTLDVIELMSRSAAYPRTPACCPIEHVPARIPAEGLLAAGLSATCVACILAHRRGQKGREPVIHVASPTKEAAERFVKAALAAAERAAHRRALTRREGASPALHPSATPIVEPARNPAAP